MATEGKQTLADSVYFKALSLFMNLGGESVDDSFGPESDVVSLDILDQP